MGEPYMHKRLGGVNFNWNQVKAAKVRKNQDGERIYTIEFKSGVKVEYPEQNNGAIQSRELTMWQSLDHDTETLLYDIKGAQVHGTKKDDLIKGENIEDCTINVSGDNNDDHVEITNSYFDYDHYNESKNNTVILGNSDTAQLDETIDTSDIAEASEENYLKEIEGPGIDNTF